MRAISISTAVFAKIWALRKPGEESEDRILRRVLECDDFSDDGSTNPRRPVGGHQDPRSSVYFPDGFEIFRTYKGRDYRARATQGRWLLINNGKLYESLNRLSQAVIDGNENAWVNWSFKSENGEVHRVAALRQSQQPQVSATSLEKDKSEGASEMIGVSPQEHSIWRNCVYVAVSNLGEADLHEIYREVRRIRPEPHPPSLDAIVRREIEYNSSDSQSYQGKHDLFYSVEGIGKGRWGIRKK